MSIEHTDVLKARLTILFKDAVLKNKLANFKHLAKLNLSSLSESDAKTIMELIIRHTILKLMDKDTKVLETLFQFSIEIALQDMCYVGLPVLVLGDMLDLSTLSECEKIFTFVESRVEIFTKEVFFKACKNHLLRSCNDLLRRLSRSQNTVFCGRILLFLARIFPLSERSGLNIISEFNFDNTTVYNTKEEVAEQDKAVDEKEVSARPFATDYNLYRKFWSLQEFFRNPTTCYHKMHWRHFTTYTNDVLTVFGSFKSDDANSMKWKQSEKLFSEEAFAYFAKYLTSQKLLELELSDSNFRRYLLIQFLILFQYLSSHVKFKLDNYVLTEEQQAWIKTMVSKVYKLLEDTPPDGPTFSKSIETILKREEHWNVWKNDGCPDFKSVDEKVKLKPMKQKRRLGDEIASCDKVFIGNAELTKLWNICPNNWEACKTSKRKFVPSMEKFFRNAIEQADPVNEIENQYKDVYDPKFAWKSLRLLSMNSPHFFTNTVTQNVTLPEYLESIIQKIPKQTDSPEAETGVTSTEETLEEGTEDTLPSTEEDNMQKKP